jgi:hypothetical protein
MECGSLAVFEGYADGSGSEMARVGADVAHNGRRLPTENLHGGLHLGRGAARQPGTRRVR